MTTNGRIPVYDIDEDGEQHAIARVRYNQRLDYWDGHNWGSGYPGCHLGITMLKDGRYVLIHGTQWQGARDYAEVVTDQEALDAIMRTDHQELLEEPMFRPLADRLAEEMEEEGSDSAVEEE